MKFTFHMTESVVLQIFEFLKSVIFDILFKLTLKIEISILK